VANIGDKAARDNGTVKKFHHDDAGLFRYREEHRNMGYMASIGDWLHLYPLSSQQAFRMPRPYTPAEARKGYIGNRLTGSRPKFCVAKASAVPRLIKEVIGLAPGKRWGASGASAELSKALERLGLTLAPDGSMVPLTSDGPLGVVPHNVRRSTPGTGSNAAKPRVRDLRGIDDCIAPRARTGSVTPTPRSPNTPTAYETDTTLSKPGMSKNP
jgi:hypothetical protein